MVEELSQTKHHMHFIAGFLSHSQCLITTGYPVWFNFVVIQKTNTVY